MVLIAAAISGVIVVFLVKTFWWPETYFHEIFWLDLPCVARTLAFFHKPQHHAFVSHPHNAAERSVDAMFSAICWRVNYNPRQR